MDKYKYRNLPVLVEVIVTGWRGCHWLSIIKRLSISVSNLIFAWMYSYGSRSIRGFISVDIQFQWLDYYDLVPLCTGVHWCWSMMCSAVLDVGCSLHLTYLTPPPVTTVVRLPILFPLHFYHTIIIYIYLFSQDFVFIHRWKLFIVTNRRSAINIIWHWPFKYQCFNCVLLILFYNCLDVGYGPVNIVWHLSVCERRCMYLLR